MPSFFVHIDIYFFAIMSVFIVNVAFCRKFNHILEQSTQRHQNTYLTDCKVWNKSLTIKFNNKYHKFSRKSVISDKRIQKYVKKYMFLSGSLSALYYSTFEDVRQSKVFSTIRNNFRLVHCLRIAELKKRPEIYFKPLVLNSAIVFFGFSQPDRQSLIAFLTE